MKKKRYEARCEVWYLEDDEEKNMWGVDDTETDEWAILPEEIDGSYNKARTMAKNLNRKDDKK